MIFSFFRSCLDLAGLFSLLTFESNFESNSLESLHFSKLFENLLLSTCDLFAEPRFFWTGVCSPPFRWWVMIISLYSCTGLYKRLLLKAVMVLTACG